MVGRLARGLAAGKADPEMKGPGVVIGWALVQRAPAGVAGEQSDVEDDSIPPGDV